MKIVNQTQKQTIATNAKLMVSLRDQTLGLLNKNNPRTLVFRTRFGIHTFGLNAPIDIVVLDQKNKVVKLKKNLKPNKIFIWNPKYNLVIELPQDSLQQTKIGDKIRVD